MTICEKTSATPMVATCTHAGASADSRESGDKRGATNLRNIALGDTRIHRDQLRLRSRGHSATNVRLLTDARVDRIGVADLDLLRRLQEHAHALDNATRTCSKHAHAAGTRLEMWATERALTALGADVAVVHMMSCRFSAFDEKGVENPFRVNCARFAAPAQM